MSKPKLAPTSPPAFLSFQGIAQSGHTRRSFDALTGENPPTMSGGYANWQTIQRPMQRALTVFTGYDPQQMTVDIILTRAIAGWPDQEGGAAWDDENVAEAVERDIAALEWMGGGGYPAGASPWVYVSSFAAGGGNETSMVPRSYRGVTWVVTGLQWGQAWRTPGGKRAWQQATVTLSSYRNPVPAPSPNHTQAGRYIVSTAHRNTALLIAADPSLHSPVVDHRKLAEHIVRDPRNRGVFGSNSRRSISWKIPLGKRVWVQPHRVQ